MLAQSFKTAEDLRLTEDQVAALQKTLTLLETDKLIHADHDPLDYRVYDDASFTGHFNMGSWRQKTACGTVCCIGGTAEIIGGVSFAEVDYDENEALCDLFHPPHFRDGKITPAQAAVALRSYLTTGDANWDLALSR